MKLSLQSLYYNIEEDLSLGVHLQAAQNHQPVYFYLFSILYNVN